MSKTLIVLSHPRFGGSRANRALTEAAMRLPDGEVAHLEGLYPDGEIDVDKEVARVLGADRIVLQFPMQWYATPPLLKAWQDAVLTRMFYIHPKTEGDLLIGRKVMAAVTAGNKPEAYSAAGVNLFPLPDLLKPLQSMAHRCGLKWQTPFLLFEAKSASDADLEAAGNAYAARLSALAGTDEMLRTSGRIAAIWPSLSGAFAARR